MYRRLQDRQNVNAAIARGRIVAILGPRQCGKTTLARTFVRSDSPNYFDLESEESLARLRDPALTLRPLKGLVVIDEVQRSPELFPLLRVLADRSPLTAKFLILGSASPALLQQSSESLAGRIETIHLAGLRLGDVGRTMQARHWTRGGFPRAFTSQGESGSFIWRKQFIDIFTQRDLPELGPRIPATAISRFWRMLAHYHGQTLNASELARAMDVNDQTVRRYADLLSDVFMVRLLQPWFENLGKRQVKAPKVYIRDTGLLHALLGIADADQLESHPKVGASWEGYAIEEILKAHQPDAAHYWATHNGAELDLLMLKGARRIGVECKRTSSPGLTTSMRTAMADLRLDELKVVYPGNLRFPLGDNVEAIPLSEYVGASKAAPQRLARQAGA